MADLNKVSQQRDRDVFPKLFGGSSKGRQPIDPSVFTVTFGQAAMEPRWAFNDVITYPPAAGRSSWVYVTSGMSDPWDDDPAGYTRSGYSGLGVEFVIETNAQASWAIAVLHKMIAYNCLLAGKQIGNAPPLDYGQRIPLHGPVSINRPSLLQNLIVCIPDHYPDSFDLASGKVEILHFIGITNAELEYGKQTSSPALIYMLKDAGVYPLTDPDRKSVI